MSRDSVANARTRRVRQNARRITVTLDGEPYIAPAEAAEILFSRADLAVLAVERRLRAGVQRGLIRAHKYHPRLTMYHHGDVLAEAERLAELFPLDAG